VGPATTGLWEETTGRGPSRNLSFSFPRVSPPLLVWEVATKLGLTPDVNLGTCEYVRCKYSDGLVDRKFELDAMFIAHFYGHIIIKSLNKRAARRKRLAAWLGRANPEVAELLIDVLNHLLIPHHLKPGSIPASLPLALSGSGGNRSMTALRASLEGRQLPSAVPGTRDRDHASKLRYAYYNQVAKYLEEEHEGQGARHKETITERENELERLKTEERQRETQRERIKAARKRTLDAQREAYMALHEQLEEESDFLQEVSHETGPLPFRACGLQASPVVPVGFHGRRYPSLLQGADAKKHASRDAWIQASQAERHECEAAEAAWRAAGAALLDKELAAAGQETEAESKEALSRLSEQELYAPDLQAVSQAQGHYYALKRALDHGEDASEEAAFNTASTAIALGLLAERCHLNALRGGSRHDAVAHYGGEMALVQASRVLSSEEGEDSLQRTETGVLQDSLAQKAGWLVPRARHYVPRLGALFAKPQAGSTGCPSHHQGLA
jgi:hypothetical protein